MEIFWKIIPEKKLLIQKFCGEFCVDYYRETAKIVVSHQHWASVEKVITDVRELNPDKAYSNMEALMEIRRNIYKRNYKNVFLVQTPKVTAITHLYQKSLAKDYDYRYYSTLKNAIIYLNLDYIEEELELDLQNLMKRCSC